NIKSYELLDDAPPAQEQPSAVSSSTVSAQPEEHTAAEDAAAQAGAAAGAAMKAALGKQSLISVNQIKLDQLMDIMGEIVITESMVASNPDLKGLKLDNFYKSTRQLRKLTDQLQDVVMSIRMVPLSGVFQKMNRIVRDMNKKLGKEVELVTVGGDTEVDKTINDVLADPFMHMIRNAMDHAIEPPEERLEKGKSECGTITLSAQNVGGEIVITIVDDGRGLNREKILQKAKKNGLLSKSEAEYTDKEVFAMIMLAGFSTNEQVTEFSGRGVGMDVVRKNLEKVNGSISVESQKDIGTTFTIKIPLTLAIVDGMEIAVNRDTFTIPITAIRQTFKLGEETKVIVDTNGAEMIMMRGECFPIIRLHRIYQIESQKTELSEGIFLLVESNQKAACIFADDLIGEQQVVVKPFPAFLTRYDIKGAGLTGCTIMGDGSISLILDINSFLNKF
ncbi:MAG: chemotaxis protein CheA, partial [Angelakisella sp.]